MKMTVYIDSFFQVTNIKKNVQNDSSEIEDLLHEMVSKKKVMNKDNSDMNGNDKMKIFTVFIYIEYFLIIIEVEKKCVKFTINRIHQLN